MKSETVASLIHEEHSNQGKSTIFGQFDNITGYLRGFMLAQKCGTRISKFLPKFTFLLEQQIKVVVNSLSSPKLSTTDLNGQCTIIHLL